MDIMQYSWFVVIVLGVVSSNILKAARQKKIEAEGIEHDQLNRVHRNVNIAMILTAGLIGFNQVLAEIQNPFYVYSQNIDNLHVAAGKVILGSFWIALLFWVWRSSTFVTYVNLILPLSFKKLTILARPVATLCVVAGLAALTFYPGNRLPVLITNAADQDVEWVELHNAGEERALGTVASNGKGIHNLRLDSDNEYLLVFKFEDQETPKQARIPFTIGEFSMGLIHIAFDQAGQLRIFDRRVFK